MLLGRAGVVPGQDLTTEAALTKLSYLLALPDMTTADIVKQMSVPLCGELTKVSEMMFEHPSNKLPNRLISLSRAGYAIAEGDLVQVQAITEVEPNWFLNEADYSGNTLLVSFYVVWP